ncbi:MAG: hypothetical protein ACR2QM_20140, partial [Longimicrobiales bacterium]
MASTNPTQFRLMVVLCIGPLLVACRPADVANPAVPRPEDIPALHHTGLNSTDPEAALDWYLGIWPDAAQGTFAGLPSLSADMDLVFAPVSEPPPGAFQEALGRPLAQSAFWHIGAFVNTTAMDASLAEIGVEHLPLFVAPEDESTVWRSGLAPYAGVVTADGLGDAAPAEPRPGGFSYVLGPDGALFELTGGPNTTASLSHVHFFHEQP